MREKRDHVIQLRVYGKQKRIWKELAKMQGVSLSNYIEYCLDMMTAKLIQEEVKRKLQG